MAHELLTGEQRAIVLTGTIEQRLQALGCPAGLAKRAQQIHENRSAAKNKKTAVTKLLVLSDTTGDYERQRKAAVIALAIDADRRAGLID